MGTGLTQRPEARCWRAILPSCHLRPCADNPRYVQRHDGSGFESQQFIPQRCIAVDVLRPQDVIPYLDDAHDSPPQPPMTLMLHRIIRLEKTLRL